MKKTIIILIIMFFVVGCFQKKVKVNSEIKEDKKEYKLSLIMAGDVLIHDAIYKDAYISN